MLEKSTLSGRSSAFRSRRISPGPKDRLTERVRQQVRGRLVERADVRIGEGREEHGQRARTTDPRSLPPSLNTLAILILEVVGIKRRDFAQDLCLKV